MERFEINGGTRLKGTVEINGAKNAALPIMAASILCESETILHNVPDVADVRQMAALLGRLGYELEPEHANFGIAPSTLEHWNEADQLAG